MEGGAVKAWDRLEEFVQTPMPIPDLFKDLGDGKTELTVTEYGYATDEAANLSKAGLEQCLDKMAESLKWL